jgi:hypothetical protein
LNLNTAWSTCAASIAYTCASYQLFPHARHLCEPRAERSAARGKSRLLTVEQQVAVL